MAKKPVTIQFTGNENLQQIMAKLPDQYSKRLMQNIFAKAARPFVNSLRGKYSDSARKGITTARGKSKQYPALYAGLVRTRSNSFGYMKAYWRTFGTLENRMSGHPFKTGRKHTSAGWRGGIQPSNAVAQVWNQQATNCENSIEKDAATVTNKFLTKYAYKG